MKTTHWFIAVVIATTNCAVVKADWNSTIAASNPLNWYRFDELTGNTAIDYGSEHRNGAYGSGAVDAVRGIAGRVGGSAQFVDQSTVFLSAPDIEGNWTAEFLLMRTGSKRSSVLIRGIPFDAPDTALKLEQFNNTHRVGYTKYGTVDATFSPGVTAELSEWIALTYVNDAAANSVKLYMNGALAGTRIDHFDLSRDQIGSWSDVIPESPLAIMDEVVLYNRTLSAAEIAAHFSAIPGLPGDFNNDGAVNAADYTVWRNSLGSNFNLNGNGDETENSAGTVDRADHELWKQRFGQSGPFAAGESLASIVVPEPATFVLAFLVILWVPSRHRF